MSPSEKAQLLTSALDQLSPDDVRTVYSERLEQARHYNNLVWTTGALMIPFAMSGHALTFRDANGAQDVSSLWFIALGSCGLALLWHLLAQWHRILRQDAYLPAALIEARWGIKPPITSALAPAQWEFARADWGLFLRLTVTFLVVLSWIIRVILELRSTA